MGKGTYFNESLCGLISLPLCVKSSCKLKILHSVFGPQSGFLFHAKKNIRGKDAAFNEFLCALISLPLCVKSSFKLKILHSVFGPQSGFYFALRKRVWAREEHS